ncbi:hypothetical protein NUACC21_25120 [Scytonema sp. NUACC21]
MAFSNYKTIGEVLKEFQITYTEVNFIIETEFIVSDYLREDLETTMRDGVVDNSEFAICENLVFPVLKEVWKSYRSQFILWSHQSFTCFAVVRPAFGSINMKISNRLWTLGCSPSIMLLD